MTVARHGMIRYCYDVSEVMLPILRAQLFPHGIRQEARIRAGEHLVPICWLEIHRPSEL
jgi:hypothetical protein